MTQEQTTESNEQKRILVISPIDWAIAFAAANFRHILPLLLLSIGVEVLLVYLRFTYVLTKEQFFIIGVAETLLGVWFITAVVYLGIALFRQQVPKAKTIVTSAFHQLPKVFFSYVFVLMVVGIALFSVQGMATFSGTASALVMLLSLPLLVISAYLVWAPLFCAAEGLAVEDSKNKIDDDVELDEDEIMELVEKRYHQQFVHKMPWELGFSRSVRFTAANVALTYTIILFLAAAHFVPLSLSSLIFAPGLMRGMMEVITITGSNAFVLLVIIGAFLMLLNKDGKQELKIASYFDPRTFFADNRMPKIVFQGKRQAYILLGLICIASFAVVLQNTYKAQQVPSNLQVSVKAAQVTSGGFFTLTITLADEVQLFQWYRNEGFRLQLGDVQKQEGEEKGSEKIQPLEVVILDEAGQPSEELVFAPRAKPLTIRLVFKIPRNEIKSDTSWSLQFVDLLHNEAEIIRGKTPRDIQ